MHSFSLHHDMNLFCHDKTLKITILVCITTWVLDMTWIFVYPWKWRLFLGVSWWWNLKCHNFRLHRDVNFTQNMRFFSSSWQDFERYSFSLYNDTSFTCDMRFFAPIEMKIYFLGFHCDETLDVIVLTCIVTWISHVTWNYFLKCDKTLNI